MSLDNTNTDLDAIAQLWLVSFVAAIPGVVAIVGHNTVHPTMVQFYLDRAPQDGAHYPFGVYNNQSGGSTPTRNQRSTGRRISHASSLWSVRWQGSLAQQEQLAQLNRMTIDAIEGFRQADTPLGHIASASLDRTLAPWTGRHPETQIEYAQRGATFRITAQHR